MPPVSVATAEEFEIGESRRRGAAESGPVRRILARHRLWRWVISLNVVGLALLALDLRCRELGNLPGINGDEAWYGVQAELFLRGEPIPWRTPSGNLLNPLFFAPQVAMHAMFGPSFVVLRATAVISGLLALAVNFWLCSRVFGRRIAIISSLVLAVLPIDLAYSRLAWDASQSLLATLPCVYLALWAVVDARKRLRASAAAIGALLVAIVVHPTNLFVAPIVLVCLSYAWRGELLSLGGLLAGWCRKPWRKWALMAAAGGTVTIGIVGARSAGGARPELLGSAFSRVANPPQYAAFLANFGRFFSGATIYEYVSGAVGPSTAAMAGTDAVRWNCLPYDLAAWIVGGWIVWGFARVARRGRPELVCLAVGWIASLFGFFLVAGPGGLAPNFERYAIWTLAPAALLASIAIGGWQQQRGRAGRVSTAFALVLGWTLLIGFQSNCLGFMRQTGGRAHRTFRTAAVEPKQAALDAIIAQRQPRQSVRILTSEWWIYWPIRYLSMGKQSSDVGAPISVELRATTKQGDRSQSAANSTSGQVWFVEFTDSAACDAMRRQAREDGQSLRETTIADFAGRPLLSLMTCVLPPSRPAAADAEPRSHPGGTASADSNPHRLENN